jgi:hypothetical protein
VLPAAAVAAASVIHRPASLGALLCGLASVDDVIAAIDVERLAGDQLGGVERQEGDGEPDVIDRDEAARRRL